jgi:hypothetical protein
MLAKAILAWMSGLDLFLFCNSDNFERCVCGRFGLDKVKQALSP